MLYCKDTFAHKGPAQCLPKIGINYNMIIIFWDMTTGCINRSQWSIHREPSHAVYRIAPLISFTSTQKRRPKWWLQKGFYLVYWFNSISLISFEIYSKFNLKRESIVCNSIGCGIKWGQKSSESNLCAPCNVAIHFHVDCHQLEIAEKFDGPHHVITH